MKKSPKKWQNFKNHKITFFLLRNQQQKIQPYKNKNTDFKLKTKQQKKRKNETKVRNFFLFSL
jgi:hypothetical protein